MGYRAFFSYARADERTAKWLHRQLDSYRTPKALVASEGALGPVPEKLHPIFRDRTDLQAGGHIDASLQRALEDSFCLVVLCTPSSAKSAWVNQECEAFLAMGRGGRIFPVIAGGEPDSVDPDRECFPPALRGRGLLAADLREIRLSNGRLVGDGREGGRLKLIAGLLGVGLDTLAQRERRRQRVLVGAFAGAALVFAASTALAGFFYLSANRNEQRAVAGEERARSSASAAELEARRARAANAVSGLRVVDTLIDDEPYRAAETFAELSLEGLEDAEGATEASAVAVAQRILLRLPVLRRIAAPAGLDAGNPVFAPVGPAPSFDFRIEGSQRATRQGLAPAFSAPSGRFLLSTFVYDDSSQLSVCGALCVALCGGLECDPVVLDRSTASAWVAHRGDLRAWWINERRALLATTGADRQVALWSASGFRSASTFYLREAAGSSLALGQLRSDEAPLLDACGLDDAGGAVAFVDSYLPQGGRVLWRLTWPKAGNGWGALRYTYTPVGSMEGPAPRAMSTASDVNLGVSRAPANAAALDLSIEGRLVILRSGEDVIAQRAMPASIRSGEAGPQFTRGDTICRSFGTLLACGDRRSRDLRINAEAEDFLVELVALSPDGSIVIAKMTYMSGISAHALISARTGETITRPQIGGACVGVDWDANLLVMGYYDRLQVIDLPPRTLGELAPALLAAQQALRGR